MISIRKYLDGGSPEADLGPPLCNRRSAGDLLSLALDAYRTTLSEMGRCSIDVCPTTGTELDTDLLRAADALTPAANADTLASAGATVRTDLQRWAQSSARHSQQQASEVKRMLLAMAQTAESVGQRDQQCAAQLHDVRAQLGQIAKLEDITAMRNSIEQSAAQLKNSVDRMVAEGKAVVDQFQQTVATFQAKLEEAEQTAACDRLTKLRSRLCLEEQLERRIAAGAPFCVAILDIDGFKLVNDTHGHVVGDELLRQFATELRSACRSSDIVGRWGGDEFIVLLDAALPQATAQVERVGKWVCGSYVVQGMGGPLKLSLSASIGLAEYRPRDTAKELLDRADAAMYRRKTQARGAFDGSAGKSAG